ncbi:hypothetical protein M513_06729 [Trichuris suis]|uniref:rRNA biogenesis protein RRP36 n=1 Tax=Trichuris suis TaxID=68888 RepID=A0A085M552_9BILA|nr:hypothetical protein M513_06729 [Trichuris suis]
MASGSRDYSNLPMEELLRLQDEWESAAEKDSPMYRPKKQFPKKRRDRDAPQELPSKWIPHPTSSKQQKQTRRDPRFDDSIAPFRRSYFKQQYAFLSDMRKEEISKELKKEKDADKKEQMKDLLSRMRNQVKSEEALEEQHKRIVSLRKENMKRLREGKRPYYIKKALLKEEAKQKRMAKLKAKGKLQKYLERKERKLARKKLPFAT